MIYLKEINCSLKFLVDVLVQDVFSALFSLHIPSRAKGVSLRGFLKPVEVIIFSLNYLSHSGIFQSLGNFCTTYSLGFS